MQRQAAFLDAFSSTADGNATVAAVVTGPLALVVEVVK
jgi:hypothetical protein